MQTLCEAPRVREAAARVALAERAKRGARQGVKKLRRVAAPS